jgi:hypothetical protein
VALRDRLFSNLEGLALSRYLKLILCRRATPLPKTSTMHHMLQAHDRVLLSFPIHRPSLTRMPKVADLAASTHFPRTIPDVLVHPPGDVSTSTSTQAQQRLTSVNNLNARNRQSFATLSPADITLSIQPDPTSEPSKTPSPTIVERSYPSPSTITSTSIRICIYTALHLPNPFTKTRSLTSTSTSTDIYTCQHRRSHTILQGRLIPCCVYCKTPKVVRSAPPSSPKPMTPTSVTISVGARPLLHTMQGFPFDFRRSDVEASRLIGYIGRG